MTIEKLLEQEKQTLINAILDGMFDTDDKEYSEMEIKTAYWLPVPPPKEQNNTLWIDISEVEVLAYLIDSEEIDDVTVIGEYAYISTGYGLMVEFK